MSAPMALDPNFWRPGTPGVDFPRTWSEYMRFFPDEAACTEFLERLRWREGFICPGCGASDGYWRMRDGLLRCRACRRRTSVTAGTVLAGSRLSLQTWLAAAWLMVGQKNGVSAKGLQRQLGIGSYRTAWWMLHTLRGQMAPRTRYLNGPVDVDEAVIGPAREHAAEPRRMVAIAIEREYDDFSRIRLRRLETLSEQALVGFVEYAVAPGGVVNTDAAPHYESLGARGYRHCVTNPATSSDPARVTAPLVSHVAVLLSRWLMGTHHGAVADVHLDRYLDEFTFRFNRRGVAYGGLLFWHLVERLVDVPGSQGQQKG